MDTRDLEGRVADLYRGFMDGEISRRDFMGRATRLGVAGAATSAIAMLSASPTAAQVQAAARAAAIAAPADLAEWSYFWLGVKRAKLARGTVASGEQMYVEYWTPKTVKHPYPIVIVHGGGGQGLDWFQTADGRAGWVPMLLEQGFKVYLVDRPGHGRSPFSPDTMGAWPAQASTWAGLERQFTAPEKANPPYGPEALRHTQWPGTGLESDPTTEQVIGGQGNAFLDVAASHAVWKERGGELLDKIGPAVIMAHSAGGPSLWLFGDARPTLVKGLVGVEPGGPPFGNFTWGLTAAPVTYDPPIKDPSELKLIDIPAANGRAAGRIQAAPARRLKNLAGIPIVVVTAPASYHWPYDLHSVAYLRQSGCTVDHIELEKVGIEGNAHFMMHEKNHREILNQISGWIEAKVSAPARKAGARPRPPRASTDPTALDLADQGFFWVGVEHKKMPYGVIPAGATYVQYLIPKQVRHALPVVLVHGGSAQMLHYMGNGDGEAGWAHYYVQKGYKVYLVDRPGHGRATYHPDALGPANPLPTYEAIVPDIRRAKQGGRWAGTGEIGDPLIDQLMANQNPTPRDNALAAAMWRKGGAAILDRIGPAIIQTHSAGGTFGWVTADERPQLAKAIVSFEGAAAPLITPGAQGRPATTTPMPKLKDIPVAYYTAGNSGRTNGPAVVAALNASGAKAEHIAFAARGIPGNGHFAMLETNRRQVFDLIESWVAQHAG